MEAKVGIFENFQVFILRTIINLMSLIPPELYGILSRTVGLLWLRLDKRHAQIAMDNLLNAYCTSLSEKEILDLRKRHFIQFARLLFDIPRIFRLKKNNLDDFVLFEGTYNLQRAFESNKGVMLITAHMGNWELMAVSVPMKFGKPLNVIARPLDYKPLGRIANELRESTGNRVLNKYDAGGIMRKLLSVRESVGILLDQKASGSQAVDVPFLGKPALTNKVAALLALRYDACVVPAFNYRMPDGRYRVIFDKPVKLTKSGDTSADIIDNTRRFNQIIEKHIKAAPENWFWTHRRWRR